MTSLGSNQMHEQPMAWSFRQGKGYTSWVRAFHGPKTAAPAKAQELIAAGYDVDYREEMGPNAFVYALIGGQDDSSGPEVPVLTWERSANRFEKSLYEHPIFAGLTEAQKRQVREKFEAFKDGRETSSTLTGTALTLYTLLIKGVESFIVNQPVVRLTETVSDRYARNGVRANVGSVITKSVMEATSGNGERAPAAVLDNKTVPAGLVGIAQYGYLKGEPHVVQAANNKWNVVIEWEAGFWATDLYTFVSTT